MFSNIFKPTLFALVLGLAAVVSGCHHSHRHDDDDPAPHHHSSEATITITSPASGSQVNSGQTLAITGSIQVVNTLHGYSVTIRRRADNAVLFTNSIHDHSSNLTFNQSWTAGTFAAHTDLELEVVATLDHEGNLASKKVNFHGMP